MNKDGRELIIRLNGQVVTLNKRGAHGYVEYAIVTNQYISYCNSELLSPRFKVLTFK